MKEIDITIMAELAMEITGIIMDIIMDIITITTITNNAVLLHQNLQL